MNHKQIATELTERIKAFENAPTDSNINFSIHRSYNIKIEKAKIQVYKDCWKEELEFLLEHKKSYCCCKLHIMNGEQALCDCCIRASLIKEALEILK